MSSSRSREKLSTQEQVGALVDEGLLRLLRESFPPLVVTPATSIEAVMYEAGVQRVISHLAECQRQARSL